MEPISWLVRFNKLHSASAIEQAINGTPGQFSKVDTNTDGTPDYIAVAEKSRDDGRAFELRAKADKGDGVVVATMLFDDSWSLVGWYNGVAPR
ncbi:MAG: hypothetical protein H6713_21720 [Myxococcales bacterium]|nr:hypothetical protein [Myxococcales bacterium]